jgi:hypothetical protein
MSIDLRKSPREPDGKTVVVVSPSTEGHMTWVVGAGDDLTPTPPASGRGEGPLLDLTFTQAETQTIDMEFVEPVELHDGQMWYTPTGAGNWENGDTFSFSAIMPKTDAVATPGAGNVTLVEVAPGAGVYVMIPSADSTGSHDIDLAQAVPVPALDSAGNPNGYWDVDLTDSTVTPAKCPGKAEWNLFDVQIESFFLKRIPMGNPLGTFDIDVYKAEWISDRWKLRLSVTRVTTGAGPYRVGGWVMFFREKST